MTNMDVKLVREGTGHAGFGYFRPLYLMVEIKAENATILLQVMGDDIVEFESGEIKKIAGGVQTRRRRCQSSFPRRCGRKRQNLSN